MKKFRLLALPLFSMIGLALMLSPSAFAANLVSSVNKNNVGTNETLQLRVVYDKRVSSSKLSLDELSKDFEVLSVSPNEYSSKSFSGGKWLSIESITWNIILAPKRSGDLLIPVFDINGDKTRAININVQDGVGASNVEAPLNVLISANADQVYVGQQLIVEIEINAAEYVGNLSLPTFAPSNADVELLEKQNSQRLKAGLRRQVLTIKYAVFPQQAGTIDIPSLTYTAVQGSRVSQRGHRIIARSEALKIQVEPIDTTYSPWFPAHNVSIKSVWSGDVNNMIVGEPMTRTVIVAATGQKASSIPPLANTVSNQYKSYKDQPQLDDGVTTNGFFATRTESEAIVASNVGELVLPEQRIRWWDVVNAQWKEAVLPSETIKVAENTTIKNDPVIEQQYSPQALANNSNNSGGSHWIWPILCALLTLIVIVQTWFIVQLKKQPRVLPTQTSTRPQNESESKAWKALKKALNASDIKELRRALMSWGQHYVPSNQRNTLDNIAQLSSDAQLNSSLQQRFNALEASLYKSESEFDAKDLVQLITALRKQLNDAKRTSLKSDPSLKPLYKA